MIELPPRYGAPPWRSTMTVDRSVYAMRTPTGFYKVGVSENPEYRRQTLQTGCPERIEIIGATQIVQEGEFGVSAVMAERRILKVLEPFKTSGEWFKLPDIDRLFLAWKYGFYSLQRKGYAQRYESMTNRGGRQP